jgi:class 3 adenylate cyclase
VRCVNCDTELIAGKQFCHVCGTRAADTCASCGSTIAPGFRFCPECGAPVGGTAPAAPGRTPAVEDQLVRMIRHIPSHVAEKIRASRGAIAGERKLVTVLFCDLVGSTAIAESLDPEEYRDLLEHYLALAFREVYNVEGIVNQLAGDGIMALFGAPIAHEDAPYRAVHAALAIRESLMAMNARLGPRTPDLQVRIGIHTGPVVVGAVGNDLKMDYTAIGDTTNLASRLQTAAEPGMILISEATHRLVRGFFRVKPGRRFEVKGKSEPVTAFAVVGVSDTTTPMAIAQARGLTPFVGREDELAQLAACFERVNDRSAQIVAIGGDAGSGKSRLLYEFRERLVDVPVTVFEARCSAMTQTVPYAPWVSMLRNYFAIAGQSHEEASASIRAKLEPLGAGSETLHPLICQLLSIPVCGSKAQDLPEDESKRRTFEAVGELIIRASLVAPVVMIIEDLHWMDEPSREMLDLAASKVCHASEMVIVSHRPDHQPFWRTRCPFTQLNLQPLSEAETIEIIRAVAGGPLPTELENGILRKAEGNPFFTEEITRALVEEGYLLRSNGQVRVTRPPSEMRLPGTIEELIGARLDRLQPHAKRTAQVAAVLGRQFRRAQLEDLLVAEGIDVAAELVVLEERGIIHRKAVLSDDEFRFGESLTQDVAYEGLLLRQRRELHERIGRLLEAAPEDTPDRSALLAHHFGLSENREKAIASHLQAARDAERIPAFPAAARFYRRAYTLARETLADNQVGDELARHALHASYGVARMVVMYGMYAAGERANLKEVVDQGRELAVRLGDQDTLASLLALYGMALTSGTKESYEEGRALIAEALRIAEQAGDPLSTVRISRASAWGDLFEGSFANANTQIDRVIRELEQLEPGAPQSDVYLGALFMRDRIRLHSDDLAGAAHGAPDAYRAAVAASNGTVQAGAATTLAFVHFLRGETADAREWAARSLEICDRIGNIGQIRPVAAMAVLSQRELGETVPARHLELLANGPVVGAEPLHAPVVVEAFLALDDFDGAEGYAHFALQTAGGRLREAACEAALALALTHRGPGRWQEAATLFGRTAATADALGARGLRALVALGHGELAMAAGDRDLAIRHLEDAQTRFAEIGYRRYEARAASLLADLAGDAQETA